MSETTVVILAAGMGTRMRSSLPKLLHPLCGRPMIGWPVAAARRAGAARIVVVEAPDRPLSQARADWVGDPEPDGDHDGGELVFAVQAEARGTADAVQAAMPHVFDGSAVIVLAGDVPLVTPEFLDRLAAAHARSGAAATMATATLADPAGYGRVVRAPDGTVERVVETKHPGDATERELLIREVNTGIFAFDGAALAAALGEVRADNAQGELYLPDVLPILRAAERTVEAHEVDDPGLMLGVNDRVGLAAVRALAQARIHERHLLAGVTVVDPAATVIDVEVEIGQDAVIAPFTSLHGRTTVGPESRIGPGSTLVDATVGRAATVLHSYVTGAAIGDGVSVGPFSYLRPGAVLHGSAKAGAFVEIKNSEIGEGTKVPHLSYIGDATVGAGTNLGAGTITANYDGFAKHRTTIGAGVKGGVDTMFVAPVTVGDGAYTAAGSVITKDVPPGALGVARQRQTNVEGYAERRPERQRAGEPERR